MTLPRNRDERGAVAVIVAVLASVLFVTAALVVDLGLARDTKRQSQNAADASALAAGNELYTDTGSLDFTSAVAAAKAYAEQNFGVPTTAWTGCTDSGALVHQPDGSNQCISFDSATAPTKVRVVVPTREIETGLGVLAGPDEISIATSARASLSPPALPCIVCVLGDGSVTHDLQNGDITADAGNIHFNGNVEVSANGLVATNGMITVEGDAEGPATNYDPAPIEGVPPIDDPLAFLTLPPTAMSSLSVKTGSPCADGPGKYSGRNLNSMTCNLSPGLYVIAGGSSTKWDLSGSGATTLSGTGVTLYFTCGTPATPSPCTGDGAWLDASGNASIEIQAPTSGPLQGAAIVYDRGNTSDIRLTGNGMAGMTGAIYGASATLDMRGNGCSVTHSAVVVNSISMSGSPPCLHVTEDPNGNPTPPPWALHLDQ